MVCLIVVHNIPPWVVHVRMVHMRVIHFWKISTRVVHIYKVETRVVYICKVETQVILKKPAKIYFRWCTINVMS